jgi:hypothetical protein
MLGTNIPASSQGHVRTEMLDFTPEQAQTIQSAMQEQQAGLLQAFQTATGRELPAVSTGGDSVDTHQAVLEQAYSFSGLLGERLPRATFSFLILVLIAAIFYRMRGRGLVWMLGCALLYILLFNLRYAVIDGRTYSLSSVLSADELILYAAVTAIMALLVGWLVFTLGTRAFRQGSAQSANTVLDWILVTVALLALPVLWSYAFNGMFVTWRLPGFTSMFLGFLSLLQILFIGVLGPLLAGVTAVVSRLRAR